MLSRYKFLALLILMAFVVSFSIAYIPTDAYGDAGGMTSHGSSSSKSSGSSSSKSSSSSSSTRSGSSGSSTSTSGGSSFGSLVVIIIVIALVIIAKKKKKVSGDKPVFDDVPAAAPVAFAPVDLAPLKEKDPNFSEQTFIEKVNNMYLQLQDSWTKKDWKPIRPFETDALFNQHAKQLQKYIDSNTTNVVDDIGILNTRIVGYDQDGSYEVLRVLLNTRIKDYVIDDATGKVIEGDSNLEIFMDYIWKMIRKQGTQTKVATGTTASQCPNCGANVSINASGECEYCGSVISSGEHDWVLSSIELVRQH